MTVFLVHCVDTEGPLFESVEATAERLRKTYGIVAEPTAGGIDRVRKGEGVPEHLRTSVAEFLARASYKSSWSEIDEMLDEVLSAQWRNRYIDDYGRGYLFNWFILDHVGFNTNPRRRSLGYGSIYEHYRSRLAASDSHDRLYWHFHPVSYFFEANKTSNSFGYTSEHLQVLSRRIIDYLDFPVAFRPGSHTERPDINLFLEQWIPFDFGNQGMPERLEDCAQADISAGRYGDWRFATDEWEVYHPDFYDYQAKGSMRRFIARCLNLESRLRPITRPEIEKAFHRASEGKPTILSVTNHDEREMRPAIDWYMSTIRAVQRDLFPDVKIRHATAVEAIRAVEGLAISPAASLEFAWEGTRLSVVTNKAIWGPQPFLCFKTKTQQYIHENFDRYSPGVWSFTFDDDTILLEQIEAMGVATHDKVGNTSVYRLTPDKQLSRTQLRVLNESDWIEA